MQEKKDYSLYDLLDFLDSLKFPLNSTVLKET